MRRAHRPQRGGQVDAAAPPQWHTAGRRRPRGADPAVFVFGQPVIPPHLASIRRAVGLLFQDPDDQLFCPTVFEDVAFGPRQFGLSESEVERVVSDALVMVGLRDSTGALPII